MVITERGPGHTQRTMTERGPGHTEENADKDVCLCEALFVAVVEAGFQQS